MRGAGGDAVEGIGVTPRLKTRPGLVVTAAAIISLYGVFALSNARLMLAMRAAPSPQMMTMTQQLPQSDYARFWYVGRRLLARHGLATPPPPATFRVDILGATAPPQIAWLYPPPMQVLAMAFAWLPLPLSFWVWRVASLILGAILLRWAGFGWAVIAAGLASPAALHDMAGGQNGTLLGAMLVAALALAERRPVAAGIIGGLLAVKPQMALMVPASWLHGRFARVFVAAFLAGLAVAGLSLVVAGWPVWWQWFTITQHDAVLVASLPFTAFFPAAGITPFYMLRSLGAGVDVARMVQFCISVIALCLVWMAWRPGRMHAVPRVALTAALAILAMPYGFSYDLVAFSIGIAALWDSARGAERLVLAVLWLLGGYTITIANDTGLLLFPLWATCGAAMAWRLRAARAAERLRSDDRA
ncbi:MAG: glycosyltransferase family 87 protein [Acidocella sp.]|nr:glycosyltransferase family 87 protein [Acidocella sp.]